MANSYENTKMPEKPEIIVKPDAIPVDDKGQPLPDPTEDLSSYLAPKGIEELRKAYSAAEEDEDVKETMEPPQRANLMRRFKGSRKGYDFYGTPARNIPNDNNGIEISPLTELFSEAEALESDFDIDKIKQHVLSKEPVPGSEFQVVETPKLSRREADAALQSADSKKDSDELLRRKEVIKDPNAPRFLDMYKESTNTKVIYQLNDDGTQSHKNDSVSDNVEVLAEHSRVSKAKKRISKKENKKAVKAQIKAEKAAAKARTKAKRKGGGNKKTTSPEEIIKLRTEAVAEAKAACEEAERLRTELEKMKSAAAQAPDKRQAQENSKFSKKYDDDDF